MLTRKTVLILVLLLLTPWTRAQGKRGIYLEGVEQLSLSQFQGDGHLHLLNPKTQEELVVDYRDPQGRYDT
ncbi:MAG: hypothetical protein Q7S98_05115, partial [Deltaproteobacteria bacterium]|nr:hypothetical protein [Deltaproteobacteria bacterium]